MRITEVEGTWQTMNRWLYLIGAVVAEVCATLALRAALDAPGYYLVVVLGYGVAFLLLGLALGRGIPVGTAYGIWAGGGVALVAVFGVVVFGETLSVTAIIGLVILVTGVYLVQTGSRGTEQLSAQHSEQPSGQSSGRF